MMYDLGVHVVRDLLNDTNRDALYQIRVKLGERTQNFVRAGGTVSILPSSRKGGGIGLPR